MANRNFVKYREEYGRTRLSAKEMLADPLKQFEQWFQAAESANVKEPNIMTLSTVDHDGQPTIRVVLMKEVNSQGIVFFTNFKSRKGREMEESPKVALNFFWQDMERQVRFDGTASKIPDEMSDQYYQTRPIGSQLGAWVSDQSTEIPSRSYLEERLEHYKNKFKDQSIPRPPHWGGYQVKPTQVEFWQGGPDRLHDRILYTFIDDHWELQRLAP